MSRKENERKGAAIEREYPLGSKWKYMDLKVSVVSYTWWDVCGVEGEYEYTSGIVIGWIDNDKLKNVVLKEYDIMKPGNRVLS
ncbi:MAG: hypothetical protein GY861_12650 [bacterium]|nr:hypothetical protein [bacterium]